MLPLHSRSKAQSAKSLDVALLLSKENRAQLVAQNLSYGEVLVRSISLETRMVEAGPTKPGKAIVEKTVNVEAAEPGDTLTFTIRCRNVGKEPLKNAALIDQLPARLEYVAKSAQATGDAIFSAELNEFGSQTLRWELKGDIPADGEFRVVFKTLVR